MHTTYSNLQCVLPIIYMNSVRCTMYLLYSVHHTRYTYLSKAFFSSYKVQAKSDSMPITNGIGFGHLNIGNRFQVQINNTIFVQVFFAHKTTRIVAKCNEKYLKQNILDFFSESHMPTYTRRVYSKQIRKNMGKLCRKLCN